MPNKQQIKDCHLSVILTGRNDNYGGEFKSRLQNCIQGLYNQLSELEYKSEIIFVNYNPLPNPPIELFIEWPVKNEIVAIKIINVSKDIHQYFVFEKGFKDVPVLEYVGKNIGIRHAKGEYILCMNPDIIFPEYFFKNILPFMSINNYLRADRIDFKKFNNNKLSGINKIHLKGHSFSLNQNTLFGIELLRLKGRLLNYWNRNTEKFEKVLNFLKWPVYYNILGFQFHLNTSGDFMLMHKYNWEKLKGYYELGGISLHKDSLMVIQATYLGLKEVCLNLPVYHCDHERRYNAESNLSEIKFEYQFLETEAKKMSDTKQPTIYNNDDWGASNFNIEVIELK